MSGFKKFILRGNAVDLAIGVVIGVAFSAVVNNLVSGIINPLIGLLGDQNFDKFTYCLRGTCGVDANGEPTGHVLLYGTVATAALSLLITAAAIYFFVVIPVSRFLEGRDAEPTTKTCPECLSSIPIPALRCAFCTVEQLDVEV
jgi:large conductance mechanosensitive channel